MIYEMNKPSGRDSGGIHHAQSDISGGGTVGFLVRFAAG
jgi:hypothetical protein